MSGQFGKVFSRSTRCESQSLPRGALLISSGLVKHRPLPAISAQSNGYATVVLKSCPVPAMICKVIRARYPDQPSLELSEGGLFGTFCLSGQFYFPVLHPSICRFLKKCWCTQHCLRGRLCQSAALQKVLARRKRVSTEQPITDYLSPSVMPPLPSQANMDSSCFARLAWSTKLQHFEERERKSTFSQHNLTKWGKKY